MNASRRPGGDRSPGRRVSFRMMRAMGRTLPAALLALGLAGCGGQRVAEEARGAGPGEPGAGAAARDAGTGRAPGLAWAPGAGRAPGAGGAADAGEPDDPPADAGMADLGIVECLATIGRFMTCPGVPVEQKEELAEVDRSMRAQAARASPQELKAMAASCRDLAMDAEPRLHMLGC
jgi:hypothetical protein